MGLEIVRRLVQGDVFDKAMQLGAQIVPPNG